MTDISEISKNMINLQLGDIIQLNSNTDSEIDNKKFYIKYIDESLIVLINIDSQSIINLELIDNNFVNRNIDNIELLSRDETPSYAIQNNLIPGNWINIYFTGDEPFVLTGEITNLEEDMIEIKLLDENVIYLDFEFKGLPKGIPIEKIQIRSRPSDKLLKEKSTVTTVEDKDKEPEDQDVAEEVEESDLSQLKEILIDADQITFGLELEEITQEVDVDENLMRFSIEKQTNDILDELLSDIPNAKRNSKVMNDIHKLIERFVQLRNKYSLFEDNGNIAMPEYIKNDDKPIIKEILKMDRNFYWLLPVSEYKKNIYDLNASTIDGFDIDDINSLSYSETLIEEEKLIDEYLSNKFSSDENKYKFLFKNLNGFYTPFIEPNYPDKNVKIQKVNNNIMSITNNLSEFNSSVSDKDEGMLSKKQYLINTYVKSFTENETIMNADKIFIKSFITLPKKILSYSRIRLPKTNILDKLELNNINFFFYKLLNSKTNLKSVFVNNMEKDNNERYVNSQEIITNFEPDTNEEQEQQQETPDKYEKYLDSFLPTNSEVLDILKDTIQSPLSIIKVLKALEIFEIYPENLNYDSYLQINNFVSENIEKYKIQLISDLKKYSSSSKKSAKKYVTSIIEILSNNSSLETIVLDKYNIDNSSSTSEILNKINNIDYGKLYNIVLVKIDYDLQTKKLVDTFVTKYERQVEKNEKLSSELQDGRCGSLVKKYTSIDDLEKDNGKEITNLDYGENTDERMVNNGDYAVLIVNDRADYFRRDDNMWIKDSDIRDKFDGLEVTPTTFCSMQENCFNKDDDCVDKVEIKKTINERTINEIYDEFKNTYGDQEDLLREKIEELLLKSIENIDLLKRSKQSEIYKYNNLKELIGESIITELDNEAIISSPYERLRDIILGQNDFVKKQNDIQKFVMYFTRKPQANENEYWLYCNETNSKLLPLFIYTLANTFLQNGDYMYQVDLICTKQGTISDDGDSWVDKHSGYFIKNIEYDSEEGYTTEGFKLKTREVLEADLGDAMLENEKMKDEKYTDREKIIVQNVTNAMANFMGINITNEKDFIMQNVIKEYNSRITTERDYKTLQEKTLQKGKKPLPSYSDAKDSILIIITLAFMLIAIQTSIPSIRTRKTFPGCIKSFKGFPLEGDDKSGLTYLCCVANKIKSGVEPWKSIKSINQSGLVKRVESILNELMKNAVVIERISEKRQNMNTEKRDEILVEMEEDTLFGFYPPLKEYTITKFANISDTFKSSLLENIRTGGYFQNEQILVLKSKMIMLGLIIQEKIQKIVKDENPLIKKNNGEAFLENACCDSKSVVTVNYFTDIDKTIINDNNSVKDLSEMLVYIKKLSKASTLFDPRNTKFKYPVLSPTFSQDIIYKAFVVFCNDKILNFDEQIRNICSENGELLESSDSIEEQIETLKENGINYSDDLFQKLLTLVNLKNSVNLNLFNAKSTKIEVMRELLEKIKDNDSKSIDKSVINSFFNLFDAFSLTSDVLGDDARELRNMIAMKNESTLNYITNYLKVNVKLSKSKFQKLKDCLSTINEFESSDREYNISSDDETEYKSTFFMQNIVYDLIKVFPNIISNGVNYTNIKIPAHWKLSDRHELDVKEIVNKYYLRLRQFYGDSEFNELFEVFQDKSSYILDMIYSLPFFSQINDKESTIFDKRMISLFNKYLFLKTIEICIDIGEGAYSIDRDKDDKLSSDFQIISSAKLSEYLVTVINMFCDSKKIINNTYESIMNKILISKEKEKDNITEYFQELTDDDRNIENIFKTHKLGKWSKGLQKGLTQYDVDTYDEERENLEKQAIKDLKLGKNMAVTDMNREIYSLELDESAMINDRIEEEVDDLLDYEDDNFVDEEYGEDYYNNDGY